MSWLRPSTWFNTERDSGPLGGPDGSGTVAFVPDGNTMRSVTVNETSAFNSAAVWAAISLISEAFGSTPAHVYRQRKSGKLEEATDHELEQVFHEIARLHPTERVLQRTTDGAMVPVVYKSAGQAHLGIGGNHYAEIVRTGRGQCKNLYLLQPRCVEVGINSTGQPTYKVYAQPQLESDSDAQQVDWSYTGPSETFHYENMLHVKGFSLDGIKGKSPLRCARESIGVALLQDQYATNQLLRGRPLGFLKTLQRLGTRGLKRVREEWTRFNEGVENMRKIGILHGGMDWVNIGASNADLEFIAQRKFSNLEVARWFRVPPHMLGELTDAKYSDVEQLMLEFILFTMLPWVVRWEEEMNLKLFTYAESFNHFVFFDLEHWLRGDSEARTEANQIRLRSGVITPDDWRAEEHKNPLPNGIGRHALVMASQYDTLERVIDGTTKLHGSKAEADPATKKPAEKKNDKSLAELLP